MKDQFNRNIEYLRLSVTEQCNLYCIYCRDINTASQCDSALKDAEFVEIVRVAASIGIDKVRITGGEPLLRDGIEELLKDIRSINIIKRISITTNGVLLTKKLHSLYSAGLSELNISLDTLDRDKFISVTKRDFLPQIFEGILAASRLGFLVKLNVVVMKDINDDEISDFARLIYEYPLFVRFIELMPLGNNRFFTKDRFTPIADIKAKCESLDELYPMEQSIGIGPARYYRFKHSLGGLGFIGPISEPFCQNCNRIRLTSAGILKPCLDYNTGVDLKPFLRPKINPDGLKNLFKEALAMKPPHHLMDRAHLNTAETLSMCHIGG